MSGENRFAYDLQNAVYSSNNVSASDTWVSFRICPRTRF